MTELLLPKIRKAEGGRIVILSSKLHKNADTVDPEVVDSKKHYGRISSYNRSKLANVSFENFVPFLLRMGLFENKISLNFQENFLFIGYV